MNKRLLTCNGLAHLLVDAVCAAAVLSASPFAGYSALKIYDAAVSRRAMLEKLQARLKPAETVTFGSVPGQYDVVIESADRNRMVRELKRRFEPVDLRGWRNMFHS